MAVHPDRKSPPRKKPPGPRSRYTVLATDHEPRFVLLCVVPVSRPLCVLPAMSIILVFTTSLGVVMNAATAPALPALPPATKPVSTTPLVWSCRPPSFFFHAHERSCSKMGNWSAVKGRLRATSAVYPVNNRRDVSLPATWRKASRDVELLRVVVFPFDEPLSSRSIWAFCLITSAGARTRHEASSAIADADECASDSWIGRDFPMTALDCS